jgi:hypothetical protein
MLKIERDNDGFSIVANEYEFGEFSSRAKDATEAAACVLHYYGGDLHQKPDSNCPFCRDRAREAQAHQRGVRAAATRRAKATQ